MLEEDRFLAKWGTFKATFFNGDLWEPCSVKIWLPTCIHIWKHMPCQISHTSYPTPAVSISKQVMWSSMKTNLKKTANDTASHHCTSSLKKCTSQGRESGFVFLFRTTCRTPFSGKCVPLLFKNHDLCFTWTSCTPLSKGNNDLLWQEGQVFYFVQGIERVDFIVPMKCLWWIE